MEIFSLLGSKNGQPEKVLKPFLLDIESVGSDLDHLGVVGVHQPEGGDVGASELEVLQIDAVHVQAGHDVFKVGCHHSDSLS